MASTYQKNRHDIGITNVGTAGTGTDVIGVMLAKEKNNSPVYQVHDAKLLVDQIATAVPGPEYTNPEEELLLGQSDFRSGFGLEVYDTESPRRYFSSIGADLRYRGMAVAGPIASTVTLPTVTSVSATDLGFENWNDATTPTNWTEDWAIVIRNGAVQREGTYCAQCTEPAGAVDVYRLTLHQQPTWNNEYKSRCFTWSEYVKTDRATFAKIAIYDGVTRTYSSEHTGGGDWELLTVTKALASNATEVTLEIYIDQDGSGSNAFVDGGTFTPPTIGAPVAFTEFNDNLYMAYGNILTKLNAGGTAFTYVYNFPATVTDIEPFTDDRLYIALGTSTTYWYMSTAEAFTQSTAAVNTFQFFKTVHTATPVLWGNDAVNKIRSNTNPINGGAAWSAQTTVGSTYYNITELVTQSGALYIMKEDMPYYLNSSGAVQNDLAPELQALTSSTSGKNTKVYKGNLYIPCGSQGLLESGTSNTFISPSLYCTNLSDFVGQVMGLAYDEEYLLAGIDNSTKVEILAGRYETIDNSTDWVWHPINEITLAGVECMYVSTIVQKRLWVASTSSSDSLYYIPLPVGYGNITADANRSFKTGSYFITPYLHGQFKNTQKGFIKLSVTLGHAYDADIYITGAYQKLGDTSWTSIGNFDGTSTNRVESIFIPLAGTDKPISTMMRFKFTFVTDDTQKTPIMLNYTVKAVLYPDIKDLIVCTIKAANEIVTKNGIVDKGMKTTIETTITNARNATWPVTIYDIDGTSQTVKFLPLPRNTPRYTTVLDEVGREKERWYNLLMMKVPLS